MFRFGPIGELKARMAASNWGQDLMTKLSKFLGLICTTEFLTGCLAELTPGFLRQISALTRDELTHLPSRSDYSVLDRLDSVRLFLSPFSR